MKKQKQPYTIQVSKKTKEIFEKDRFQIRQKEGRLITQDEFLDLLIKCWREQK